MSAVKPISADRRAAVRQTVGMLTLNVQSAAAARAARQISWIASHPFADIVVLTEVPKVGDHHAFHLRAAGYEVVVAPPCGDARTLIASRFGTLFDRPSFTGGQPHRALSVEWSYGDARLVIAGLYVPSRGPAARRNVAKRRFQSDTIDWIEQLAQPDTPLVAVGDLNVVERGHVPHHRVFGEWEYAFYESFARADLFDLFRQLHPTAEAHSWYGHAQLGYRFDYCFGAKGVLAALLASGYEHEPRSDRLSDHAALVTVLKLDCLSG